MKCIIPDTSAVIIGAISELIENSDLDYPEIIVPEAVVCELEHQANDNRTEGLRSFRMKANLQSPLKEKGQLITTSDMLKVVKSTALSEI